jgi:hypothetical protein
VRKYHPKHVEQIPDVNKLCNDAIVGYILEYGSVCLICRFQFVNFHSHVSSFFPPERANVPELSECIIWLSKFSPVIFTKFRGFKLYSK